MIERSNRPAIPGILALFQVVVAVAGALVMGACERAPLLTEDDAVARSWSALMEDGDADMLAPGSGRPMPPVINPQPTRFCPGATPAGDASGNIGDCARAPLAFWRLDDCNAQSTQLADTAFTSPTMHPAFRAVSAACTAGFSNQGVRLAGADDVVYAPDQPDFDFSRGVTVAGWINPDRTDGVQNIIRKRLDGSSSFALALDGRALVFVVRLTDGRLAGVAAPGAVRAGRFTHVAATYDGTTAIVYVNGVEAARARGRGRIAAGAGPIFIGNDASGRRLRGVVDELWLNTLAAPADTVADLTCVHQAPVAVFTPAASAPVPAGTVVPFDLAITNQNTGLCQPETFSFFSAGGPPFLVTTPVSGSVVVANGATAHVAVKVTTGPGTPQGGIALPFFYLVSSPQAPGTIASATYVVARPTGPFACSGSPPLTPQIIGPPPLSPTGPMSQFTFSAPGLAPPVFTVGSDFSLQVSVNPGVSTDPANAFLGFGFGFFNPPCLDARAFNGIQFTLSGDLGTCTLAASLAPSQDNSTANGPFGTCDPAAGPCLPPQSGPLGPGVNVVHFSDMTGGSPVPTLDPSGLNAIQWILNVPSDGVTPPCMASFTISDVKFINDSVQHRVSFTFDTDGQGWELNTFDGGTPPVNLAVHPPVGVRPPTLTFNAMDGNPLPGSLAASVTFTGVDQYLDPNVNLPAPIDLTGAVLHARVRVLSGGFPSGGLQFHASSGPNFVFAAAPFVGGDAFPVGVWVPLDFDLGNPSLLSTGFDPSQIVQIGVQFFSGFSDGGGVFVDAGPTVLEIDTVTD